ncbi:MAG: DUF418 domain-containing protein [Saprospiraceae bacterium]|nr:DUF418 domain-containing protein [Saprospiraceae bacterium]
MKRRIVGIDVARALAIIGMIIVNFKVVFGSEGSANLKSIASFFDGKAAAMFVVLAGVGIALMTNSAIKNTDNKKLRKASSIILKRAILLFIIGLSYVWIWPADILHYYGIYMIISLLFLSRSNFSLITGTIFFIGLFPILLFLINYETGWNFDTLEYESFWSLQGFIRNLFYNGFHPVIPWTAFMLFGIWLGRQDLQDDAFIKKSFWVSLLVFCLIQVVSFALLYFGSAGDTTTYQELAPILGTAPMPPMPLYMVNGIAAATCTIAACIYLAKKYERSFWVSIFSKTGKLALTFYVAHVILGMGCIEIVSAKEFGSFSLKFSLLYALTFSLICIIFASVWLRYKKIGPLEWIIRKLTN